MSHKVIQLLFVATLLVSNANGFWWNTNNYGVQAPGGTNCAGCTIIVGLLEQLVLIRNTTVDKVLDDICGYFPNEFQSICDYYVNNYGEKVIALIEAKETADSVCLKLGICVDATCRLFPAPKKTSLTDVPLPIYPLQKKPISATPNGKEKIGGVGESPWDWIKALFNRLGNGHQPIEDLDTDAFSMTETLRGWSWKGKDCNDVDKLVHPGVTAPPGQPGEIDWNCNGISGIDPKTKLSYEELLCGNSSQRGIIVVGDSFGAHFSIPPSYMNASEINNQTYSNLLYVLENEFDWPERSAFTGFEQNTSAIPIDSLYLRMRERNLCNHRDYQNVGVNGARSGAMDDNVIKSIARNQTDSPVLLIYELVGNDVCTPHPDLSRMTTPTEFYTNVVGSLQYLDTILPQGSHVVFVGLADGRVLWDNLYNRTHPIGVTYESVYNFLNCLQISPCWVWMNDNETIRDAGSARAAELNQVYGEIIANNTFKNFDMVYYDFPFPQINEVWLSRGGQTWQLIEPVDGFHPNQIAHSLIAEYLWSQFEQYHPDFIGEINPNNELIAQLFGDQGGY